MSVPPWDALDEDILEVGTSRRPRSVGVVAVLALVLSGAIWLGTRGSSEPSAAPSATSTAPRAGPRPIATVAASESASAYPRDPTSCPAGVRCAVSHAVPARFLGTVREYFPRAVLLSAYTVVRAGSGGARDMLWYRGVSSYEHGVQVIVMVSSAASVRLPTSESVASATDLTIGFVSARVDGYLVQLEVVGSDGWRPPMRTLRALAHDRRLTTLP